MAGIPRPVKSFTFRVTIIVPEVTLKKDAWLAYGTYIRIDHSGDGS